MEKAQQKLDFFDSLTGTYDVYVPVFHILFDFLLFVFYTTDSNTQTGG